MESLSEAQQLKLAFTPLENPDPKLLEYPFGFIGIKEYEYELKDIFRDIPGEKTPNYGDFPNNIVEYYWIHEGENDADAWTCLCKLDNKTYVFYTARCDYTGFDCQGDMIAYASKSKKKLFNMGMDAEARYWCLKDKMKSS